MIIRHFLVNNTKQFRRFASLFFQESHVGTGSVSGQGQLYSELVINLGCTLVDCMRLSTVILFTMLSIEF